MDRQSAPPPVDAGMRATLRGLADVLLPAQHRMPAASAVDVAGEGLDRVLAARPDLAAPLASVLATATGREPAAEVGRLRAQDQAGFLALASACLGAYYLDPGVRGLIGYPGQEPSLPDPGEADRDLGDDLLAPVLARGPVYRPTPAP